MVVYYGEKFGKFEDFLCLSCYEMDRNNGFFIDYGDDDLCFGVLCDGEFCGGVLCDGIWYVGDMCDGVVYVSIVCDGILCDVFLFDEMRVSFVGLFFYGVCSQDFFLCFSYLFFKCFDFDKEFIRLKIMYGVVCIYL